MSVTSVEDGDRPLLRVVRGEPTPEELAALVAVVTARRSAGDVRRPRPRSRWAAPDVRMRRPLPHGPDAWRASARPR